MSDEKYNYTLAPCCHCTKCWHKLGEGYHAFCLKHLPLPKEAPMKQKTWPCEHIVWFDATDAGPKVFSDWTWKKDKNYVSDDTNFCSKCGAVRPPRPAEKPRDYQVNILIEPYKGDDRESGNVFSFESAEELSRLLRQIRINFGRLESLRGAE